MGTGTADNQELKTRAINLFTFLREVVNLRTKVVRDLAAYETVIWLANVPREPECRCIAWEPRRDEEADSTWIEVRKPRLVGPPKLPEAVKPWVNSPDLVDSSREPALYERILDEPAEAGEEGDDADGQEGAGKGEKSVFISLVDRPQVRQQWEEYLTRCWRPWAEKDHPKQAVQRAYMDLFALYQQQKELGESYEVLLGLGQLRWTLPSGQTVNRHLIAVRASLEFDPNRGVITVGPPADGAKPRLEQDMLEPSERPAGDIQNRIEQDVVSVEDDVWHSEKITAALRSWVHSVAEGQGAYEEDLPPLSRGGTTPTVRLAPALVLRKRTERGVLRLYDSILADLRGRPDLPPGLGPLVEVGWQDTSPEQNGETLPGEWSEAAGQDGDNELFFPLPSNDEQRQIVDRMNRHKGVLVQGPPGTGKSHTIANLISHLLAHGKRVLVTSHTPRALRVLKDKIPQEVADLCVVLLGHDQKSFEGLEGSIHGITQRLNTWDPRRERANLQVQQAKLKELRAQAAKTEADLRAIREAETYRHPPMNGDYAGTLQSIAKRLQEEESHLAWVRDFAPPGVNLPELPPLSDGEAMEFLEGLRAIRADRQTELACAIPRVADLPEPERFDELVTKEAQANEVRAEAIEALGDEGVPDNLGGDEDAMRQLVAALDSVLAKNAAVEGHVLPFAVKLALDARSNQDGPWGILLKETKARIGDIEGQPESVRELTVTGHEHVDMRTLCEDAATLFRHLKAGGRLKRWWGGYAPVVRDRVYMVERVRVGGKPCRAAETVETLWRWAYVQDNLRRLHGLWQGVMGSPQGNIACQLAMFRDYCEPIGAAMELHQAVQEAKEALALVCGAPHPKWHVLDEVWVLRQQIAAAFLALEARGRKADVDRAMAVVDGVSADPDSHPIVPRLISAITNRDRTGYRQALRDLGALWADRQRLARREELADRLREDLPRLAEAMALTPDDTAWPARVERFGDSWNWLRTEGWLRQQLDPARFDRLVGERDHLQRELQRAMTDLTAGMAWSRCMERMTPVQETYLKAWMQAIRKIGAGTGKRAARYRKVARGHLEQCRSTIPAWIMPVYRIVESVTPGEDLFDVAIIDEASQSGMDALFLHYIAKQVVVVGDDKQIAPDYVGSKRDEVELLRHRHIPDLPLADHYDLEHSFFDQAFIRYGNRVRLREHFRCMPEIIQFSNDLCYQNEPLIPLRQYGDDRLEPVVTAVYVPEGYMKGGTTARVNPEEAQKIVDKIEELCNDRHYDGKTFGVISLLGEHQARVIEGLLLKQIGPEEIERRRLVCGDAYAFQGDERNVMFLSLVVASSGEGSFATLTGSSHERRFNVAASRAQDQLWLFHSVTLDELSPKCLRYRLLAYCQSPGIKQDRVEGLDISELERSAGSAHRPSSPPPPFESWFEVDVFLRIHRRGYRVLPQYRVADYRIDLVVAGMKERIAVECDGEEWHGPDRYEADMARQRQLERCGWRFWRVRGGAFYRSPEKALEPLWAFLDRHGVLPGGRTKARPATANGDDGAPSGNGGGKDAGPSAPGEETTRSHPPAAVEDVAPDLEGQTEEEEDRGWRRLMGPYAGAESSAVAGPAGQPRADATVDSGLPSEEDLAGPVGNESPDGGDDQRAFQLRSVSTGQKRLFDGKNGNSPCPDPRTAAPRDVRQAIVSVIYEHGPMPCHYAYRIYAQRAGVGRLSKLMRGVLNSAIAAAVRAGALEQENEYQTKDQVNQIVRAAGSPRVVPRPRGERDLADIPPSEVADTMWEITRQGGNVIGRLSQEALFRPVLEHYGFVRLTAKVQEILTVAYQIYWRNAQ